MNQEEVRRLFDYNADTGELVNKVTRGGNAPAGSRVGCDKGNGYLMVGVNKKFYLVHRLIWLWVHGYFPENNIDHINRDRSDNRLVNLREVSQSCNARNSTTKSNNTSGVNGISWDRRRGKWRPVITVNRKDHHLGYFQDFTEAVKARHAAEIEYNWPGCNDSTDAYQYLKEIQNERATGTI